MQEYIFEVRAASARVRARSEGLAYEVISSALRSPSLADIKLANQASFVEGIKATIVSGDASYLSSVSGESRTTVKGNVGLRVTW
jgi:hypothetical protein